MSLLDRWRRRRRSTPVPSSPQPPSSDYSPLTFTSLLAGGGPGWREIVTQDDIDRVRDEIPDHLQDGHSDCDAGYSHSDFEHHDNAGDSGGYGSDSSSSDCFPSYDSSPSYDSGSSGGYDSGGYSGGGDGGGGGGSFD